MKFFKDSTYSLLSQVISLIIIIIGLAILGRQLTPSQFGVFAIILATQALFQPFLDMGLMPAYIKKESVNQEFTNSFFSINFFLGMLNFLFLLFSIPILTIIYDYHNLSSFIFVFSISIILTSLSLQGKAELMREKEFKSLFIVNITSTFLSTFLAIISAYEGFGIWSLIIKAVTFSLITFLMVIYFKGFAYKLVSLNIIKKYILEIKFGFDIFINRLITGLFNSMDKLAFGKIFDVNVVGNYSNASQIIKMPDSIIRTSLTSVAYSHLERMTIDKKRTQYIKYYGSIFLLSSIPSWILIFFGDVLILTLLGQQWILASKYINTLGFFSLGMTIKGIFTMISMHENIMVYLNKINMGSFSCLLATIGIAYYTHDIQFTLKFFSYSFLVYWILATILIIKGIKK